MAKLWNKNYDQDKAAEAYCFGENLELDNQLAVFDVLGSIAHAQMLCKIGILSETELIQLKKGLLGVLALIEKGQFKLSPGDEDIHTKVENHLTKQLGEVGKKLHTARSRNDQVLVDLRLHDKSNLAEAAKNSINLAKTCLSLASVYEWIPMPGYTHMQKAMPSSVGMWAASFAESLIEDLNALQLAYEVNDQSPLGSGAAYGVSLPIDRGMTAKLLGFGKVQNNSLYAQCSRGKSQLATAQAMSQVMLTLSRLAQDLMLFTTSEFEFFVVDKKFCTGSSIMPQKKNLDVMEVVRARAHQVVADTQVIAAIVSGLPSGYNADFGETKAPYFRTLKTTIDSLVICNLVLQTLKPNEQKLTDACSTEIYATHAAYLLVKQGMPFRDAYKQIGLNLDKIPEFDKQEVLKLSNHQGGTGDLGLAKVKDELVKKSVWWKSQDTNFLKTLDRLKGGGKNEK